MIKKSNSKKGSETERKVCELLAKKGYWAHRFQRSEGGQQPCDIVALKSNKSYLIDGKHCEKPYLATYRIEPNQRNCFQMASEKGIECLFACEYQGEIYAIRWQDVDLNKSMQKWKGTLDETID